MAKLPQNPDISSYLSRSPSKDKQKATLLNRPEVSSLVPKRSRVPRGKRPMSLPWRRNPYLYPKKGGAGRAGVGKSQAGVQLDRELQSEGRRYK